MARITDSSPGLKQSVADSFSSSPVVGVVRTATNDEARTLAEAFLASGLQLVEITFTTPGATELIAQLRETRATPGPPWIGAGSVTDRRRAAAAIACGAEFLVSPNVSADVAAEARQSSTFLVMGALTPSEIFTARQLGADLVKVYPLPPIGGPAYLATIRQPLPDIPILAAGGFAASEISAYRKAGAVAFGIGAQLLGEGDESDHKRRVEKAVSAARGENPA
ncbi:MAG: hypothetical protein OEM62_03405 [Acidobacteriota bacterium]|nr:hypothetical protein [Acidobacteriota bacterium]